MLSKVEARYCLYCPASNRVLAKAGWMDGDDLPANEARWFDTRQEARKAKQLWEQYDHDHPQMGEVEGRIIIQRYTQISMMEEVR